MTHTFSINNRNFLAVLSKMEKIHTWLVEQYEAEKLKNKLAHKKNDILKKERARGAMLAFKKAFIHVQEVRKHFK